MDISSENKKKYTHKREGEGGGKIVLHECLGKEEGIEVTITE